MARWQAAVLYFACKGANERRKKERRKRKLGLSIFNILYFTKNSWGYAPLSKEA
jgi:hypothetical protein